jgi:multiple sugar transport system ATP-binding protein
VVEVARILRISHLLDRPVSGLAGGDRQRVALGRAIVRKPKCFLMDEPLGALDTEMREAMIHELRALHDRLGATTVYVTHDQLEAMAMADMIAVMNNGVVEQVASPRDIYDRPASLFVADFIGSPPMNFLPVRVLGPDMVALESDQRLRLRCGAGALDVGAAVVAGFRPEDMQLIPAASAGAIPFATDMVEELGASKLLHGQLAGAECIAAVPSAISLSTRATLFAQIAPESIHLFDGETGTRMR